VEDVIVDFAHDWMQQKYPQTELQNMVLPKVPQNMEHLLLAAKYTVEIKQRMLLNQEIPIANFVLDERHVVETSYHPRHFEWLCSMLLPQVSQSLKFRGCTEHKHHGDNGKSSLFCAHPSFCCGEKWHNWALFNWSVSGRKPCSFPHKLSRFYLSRRICFNCWSTALHLLVLDLAYMSSVSHWRSHWLTPRWEITLL
jgi:hypothetical protein